MYASKNIFVGYPGRNIALNARKQMPLVLFDAFLSTYKLKNINYPHYYTPLHFIFASRPFTDSRPVSA